MIFFLHNFNYLEFYNHHIKNNFDITLVASTKSFKIPYGVCEINKKVFKKYERKTRAEFPSKYWILHFKRKVISLIPINKKFDLTDLIKLAKNKGFKVVFPIDDHNWTDIGQIDNYFQSLKNEN